MKKLVYSTLALALTLVATPVLAQGEPVRDIEQAGDFITNLISGVAVPVIFALAFIVFIWGVFSYFIAGGHDEERRKKGKELMLYGILGFFIMISVWGLVNILVNSVSLDEDIPSQLPETPGVDL